ncbi:hypothetical protein [Halanaerobium hydrogeniformans]|uniref:Uncharacterized protein n=1 Tax=Halanaerobium hydrogeniformans TaxID=656519 RepID=E4RLC2_HALHG|nr:hypothetical protein [Halanaerobium hydrogeniformans]ADQ14836.1 hypothetical protein Halsa_1409 [Halanaerobium hydrogeniformans]
MKLITDTQFKIILLILIILMLCYTAFNVDRNFKAFNNLKLEAVSTENNLLKAEKLYQEKKFQNNKNLQNLNINLEKRAAQLIQTGGSFGLKLLRFNSSSEQINLNFRGDFNSAFNFLKYLETEQQGIMPARIKLAREGNDLLFDLRIIRGK